MIARKRVRFAMTMNINESTQTPIDSVLRFPENDNLVATISNHSG
jgi:hypothetical protein